MISKKNNNKGITLVELMIVIIILGILMATAIPYLKDFVLDSKKEKTVADLKSIKSAINKYQFKYETDIEDLSELKTEFIINIMEMEDSWKVSYRLNTTELLVYSCGANGMDERGFGDDISQKFLNRVSDLERRKRALLDLKKIKYNIDNYFKTPGANIEELKVSPETLIPGMNTFIDPWGRLYRINTADRKIFSTGKNFIDEDGFGDDISTNF